MFRHNRAVQTWQQGPCRLTFFTNAACMRSILGINQIVMANRCLPSVVLMLARRLRRRANISTILGERVASAGRVFWSRPLIRGHRQPTTQQTLYLAQYTSINKWLYHYILQNIAWRVGNCKDVGLLSVRSSNRLVICACRDSFAFSMDMHDLYSTCIYRINNSFIIKKIIYYQ